MTRTTKPYYDKGGHGSPFEEFVNLCCEVNKADNPPVIDTVIHDDSEGFVDLMEALHLCCACEQICDCTEGSVQCVGCEECVEYYIKSSKGPAVYPGISEDELADIPLLPSEVAQANWCCGFEMYPFHYTDCDNWGGMGIGKVRGERD